MKTTQTTGMAISQKKLANAVSCVFRGLRGGDEKVVKRGCLRIAVVVDTVEIDEVHAEIALAVRMSVPNEIDRSVEHGRPRGSSYE